MTSKSNGHDYIGIDGRPHRPSNSEQPPVQKRNLRRFASANQDPQKKTDHLFKALSQKQSLAFAWFIVNPDDRPESKLQIDQDLASILQILSDVVDSHTDGKEINALSQLIGFSPFTVTSPQEASVADIVGFVDRLEDGINPLIPWLDFVSDPEGGDRRPLAFIGAGNLELNREAAGLIMTTFNPLLWGAAIGGDPDDPVARFFLMVGLKGHEIRRLLGVGEDDPYWQMFKRAVDSRTRIQDQASRHEPVTVV